MKASSTVDAAAEAGAAPTVPTATQSEASTARRRGGGRVVHEGSFEGRTHGSGNDDVTVPVTRT